jgi:hypothetical protein
LRKRQKITFKQVCAESGGSSPLTLEQETNAARLSKDGFVGRIVSNDGETRAQPKDTGEWLKNFQTG